MLYNLDPLLQLSLQEETESDQQKWLYNLEHKEGKKYKNLDKVTI